MEKIKRDNRINVVDISSSQPISHEKDSNLNGTDLSRLKYRPLPSITSIPKRGTHTPIPLEQANTNDKQSRSLSTLSGNYKYLNVLFHSLNRFE